MSDERPYVFWDEAKQRSEFHWEGFVVYGADAATMELLQLLNNFRRYRDHSAAAYIDISRRLDTWMDGATRVAEGKDP